MLIKGIQFFLHPFARFQYLRIPCREESPLIVAKGCDKANIVFCLLLGYFAQIFDFRAFYFFHKILSFCFYKCLYGLKNGHFSCNPLYIHHISRTFPSYRCILLDVLCYIRNRNNLPGRTFQAIVQKSSCYLTFLGLPLLGFGSGIGCLHQKNIPVPILK